MTGIPPIGGLPLGILDGIVKMLSTQTMLEARFRDSGLADTLAQLLGKRVNVHLGAEDNVPKAWTAAELFPSSEGFDLGISPKAIAMQMDVGDVNKGGYKPPPQQPFADRILSHEYGHAIDKATDPKYGLEQWAIKDPVFAKQVQGIARNMTSEQFAETFNRSMELVRNPKASRLKSVASLSGEPNEVWDLANAIKDRLHREKVAGHAPPPADPGQVKEIADFVKAAQAAGFKVTSKP